MFSPHYVAIVGVLLILIFLVMSVSFMPVSVMGKYTDDFWYPGNAKTKHYVVDSDGTMYHICGVQINGDDPANLYRKIKLNKKYTFIVFYWMDVLYIVGVA